MQVSIAVPRYISSSRGAVISIVIRRAKGKPIRTDSSGYREQQHAGNQCVAIDGLPFWPDASPEPSRVATVALLMREFQVQIRGASYRNQQR